MLKYAVKKCGEMAAVARGIGPSAAALYYMQGLRRKLFRLRRPYRVWSKDARFPIRLRPGATDMYVFEEIFVNKQFSCFDPWNGEGLVLDLGGYTGIFAAYFLSRFPRCRIVTVESDPENFAVLQRNLAPYGDRVRAVHGAVWSHRTSVCLSEEQLKEGREWAREVREARPGEPGTVPALDIPAILEGSGADRIAILKMNIEGAEAVVFSGCERWLPAVDSLIMHIHDGTGFGPCRERICAAMEREGFSMSAAGGLTLFTRGKIS
ncbi:MAG: FkbM family methyltransferase [Elusimicrobiales bacterium]|jgi:FkbM family methyltransferase